ncbi:hypothetical protein EFQ24_06150 [Limosilactobacillus fermentum]|nr:hypothetical protein [Limosilactobacillus fermentum]MCT3439411.1 hypothetical protein [Limosilactobacillus fermentum]MCT3456707.1 hypothetical protein [Limosilactobacillus fermentum]
MGLIILLICLWIMWKLLKMSFWLLGLLITIALIIFAVKILIIPGLILIFLIFAGSFFKN